MDRKVEYVDLNGLQFFADELRQYLKQNILNVPILTELKTRIENLEDRDFYKIIESYDKLPNPGSNSIIYLVPNNGDGGLLEYIWTNNGYEQLGSFSPELKLDEYLKSEDAENKYLKISDSPFEKGSGENSAVLKGGNNQVISERGVAIGNNNLVGLKGWYYKAISFNSSTGEIQLYLSKTQQAPKAVSSASQVEQEKDIVFPLSVGTIVSVVNDVKYDNKFKIERIDELSTYGRIKLSRVDGNKTLYFNSVKVETDLSPEDYSIYCLSEPTKGIVDLGQSSFVTGDNNKAINGKSVSFGINNTSWGKCAFTEGMSNEAGYAAHAEGKGNKAIGNHSHAEGQNNEAWKTSSHAEGATNITYGPVSHIEGKNNYIGQEDTTVKVEDTSTKGYAAHAEGQANVVLGNSAHAEGIKNKVYDNGGHAEGRDNVVKGIYAHAEGRGNTTNNEYEHASGKYNVSIQKTTDNTTADATHFSIGIGSNISNRKNAFEIKQNGYVYITGIGGFTGANSSSSKSVQEVINELVDIISQITIKVEE